MVVTSLSAKGERKRSKKRKKKKNRPVIAAAKAIL